MVFASLSDWVCEEKELRMNLLIGLSVFVSVVGVTVLMRVIARKRREKKPIHSILG